MCLLLWNHGKDKMMEKNTKTVKVACLLGWRCGFYPNFEAAKADRFTACYLCGLFIIGSRGDEGERDGGSSASRGNSSPSEPASPSPPYENKPDAPAGAEVKGAQPGEGTGGESEEHDLG
jgi:hypothetical protein